MMLLECFVFGVTAFLMTGVKCEESEVIAEAGSQAVLPCKYNILTTTSPAIIWSKVKKGTVWRMDRSGLRRWASSWSQNGTVRVRCPHHQFERGDYSLQINSVTEEDGGRYSCMLNLEDKTVETFVTLRIIKVSISPSVAIWGNDVSVKCTMTPWHDEASVQWMLNNSPFVPQARIISNEAERAVKEKATARLTGSWTCVVGYKGIEGRASATLTVKGIIKPSTDNTKVYAAVGSAVSLPCVFSSGLIPLNPVWQKLKAGSLFRPATDRLPPSFSTSSSPTQLPWDKSARLNEVRFEDEGKYRCVGAIQGQRLSGDMQLVVAKIVSSTEKDSVTLTCQLSDTSEITKYEWVHVTYDLNGTESVGPIQKGKTLTISEVSEDNWGEWTCRFYGKTGILGNVTHHAQLMSRLSGQKSSDLSHNTLTIVGLSFLLLVLLLVLAQMYKNHQRRKRIFQYPALETIVHTIANEREERERSRVKK